MRTVSTEVFLFNELSEKAKEKAIALNRDTNTQYGWHEDVYEDAVQVAELLGITLDTKHQGKSPAIYFSGFCSQGDGACFEGEYRYAKGAVKEVQAYAPEDSTLLDIAKSLQETQRTHFYRLRAKTKHQGHYYHSGCMQVEVYDEESPYNDIGNAEESITEDLRRFADWIYQQLEAEHTYLTSAKAVASSLEANEVEFLIDGRRYAND